MRLNTLSPEVGSKTNKKRLGRGIGSGLGKTSGKGHKGQYARAGGYHKVGFEGGQMPMQRRLPKFGFTALKSLHREEVRLNELQGIEAEVINLSVLKEANVVRNSTQFVKIIGSGELTRKIIVHCSSIGVTKGAKASIEKVGGKVEASN